MGIGEAFVLGYFVGALAFCLVDGACLTLLFRERNGAHKCLVEILVEAGHSQEVITEAILETYQATGELPRDSFSCGLHTRKGGGWVLMWDRTGRKGLVPYIKEIE
jgi:hypothetical protein